RVGAQVDEHAVRREVESDDEDLGLRDGLGGAIEVDDVAVVSEHGCPLGCGWRERSGLPRCDLLGPCSIAWRRSVPLELSECSGRPALWPPPTTLTPSRGSAGEGWGEGDCRAYERQPREASHPLSAAARSIPLPGERLRWAKRSSQDLRMPRRCDGSEMRNGGGCPPPSRNQPEGWLASTYPCRR